MTANRNQHMDMSAPSSASGRPKAGGIAARAMQAATPSSGTYEWRNMRPRWVHFEVDLSSRGGTRFASEFFGCMLSEGRPPAGELPAPFAQVTIETGHFLRIETLSVGRVAHDQPVLEPVEIVKVRRLHP